MFSRSQFQAASEAFSRCHPQWRRVNAIRPGYEYLNRTTSHIVNASSFHLDDDYDYISDSDDIETEDSATAISQSTGSVSLTVQEYIAYSASFCVPAFYFTAHHTNGIPCSLDDLIKSSFFKARLPKGSEATDFALTLATVPFPLLSQGELPGEGRPCWYFHPCESARAVNEFLVEVEQGDWNEETRLVRWMELWLMIVGSVLNV